MTSVQTKAMVLSICIFIMMVSIGIAAKPSITVEPTDEMVQLQKIQELQQKVYEQGYNYKVAQNWITLLPPEEEQSLYGYKPLMPPTRSLPENVKFNSWVMIPEPERVQQPSTYDAMALGHVTPIKNQLACGSCWIFAATADFESDVAISESILRDFSEQEVGDCNIWSSLGGYNFCNGGNRYLTNNYFTMQGMVDETCHPYVATPQTCQNCPILKNVDNVRLITFSNGESQITTIKDAILTYGPVQASMYAGDIGFKLYNGGVYEYWGPQGPNHAVEIIGWDDSLPHSHGTGAWMIKNSWGTGWGASGPYPGCAWVAYGAANLGDNTNAIASYKNPGDILSYHDECGWMGWSYGTSQPTAYGAVRFTPSQDSTLTAVDFWAVDANMGYEIKLFDTVTTFPTYYSFSNQRGTTQTGVTKEPGYYSIHLNTPVQLTSGDDFIVQMKLTSSAGWPIPIDYSDVSWLPPWSSIATFSGESYYSTAGVQFTKPSVCDDNVDVGIRARAQPEVQKPTVTVETDKTTYYPDDTMITTICFKNPSSNSIDTYFLWYLGLPDYGYWEPMLITPLTLTPYFNQCYDFPLPVGDLGPVGFKGAWYVACLETKPPYPIICQDTTEWRYEPIKAAIGEIVPEEIAEEITKEMGRAELPS